MYHHGVLRLRVRYGRAADVLSDYETQLSHHGLFVRVVPPADLQPFGSVELAIELGDVRAVVTGQVVQIAAGVGVAVSFPAAEADALTAVLQRARAGGDVADSEPEHAMVTDDDRSPKPETGRAQPRAAPPLTGKAEKINKALRGTKDERLKILRDHDKTLHMYVLKNPRLGLDEVGVLAKTATTSVEVIKTIAERREWYQRPEIALALVRNPKTPVPIAIRLLDHISKQELRRLAKSDGARMPILQAARKKVIGPR